MKWKSETLIFHLVSTHAMTIKKANFLVLLPPHVVHTLVGLHISYLEGEKQMFQLTTKISMDSLDF